ncbi:thioredoxin-like protein [Pavlovales sp. CCMP2436]|nr:thioredoxin-like protein [Pavlovales sp. CCMP2436]
MASTESPAGTKLAGVKLAGTTLAGVRPAGVELAGTKLGANPPSSIEGVEAANEAVSCNAWFATGLANGDFPPWFIFVLAAVRLISLHKSDQMPLAGETPDLATAAYNYTSVVEHAEVRSRVREAGMSWTRAIVALLVCANISCASALMGTPRSAVLRTRVRGMSRASALMGGKAEELNTEGFSVAAQGDVPLVVDVYATWCGPCQLMAPQLELVANAYEERVRVVKIDSDKEQELSAYLKIMGLPTLLFIKDKAVVGRIEGAMMQDEISSWIDHFFFDGPKP